MSCHLCKTTYQGKPVCVRLGWDRPLQYFHLLVEFENEADFLPPQDPDDEAWPYLYSNLEDPDVQANRIDYFREKLAALQITVPESMFVEALSDCVDNVGNRDVVHALPGGLAVKEE